MLKTPRSLDDFTIARAGIPVDDVAIIGDYDVDGATSSSVLRLYLESVGIEPEIHIPERDEGYGPSRQPRAAQAGVLCRTRGAESAAMARFGRSGNRLRRGTAAGVEAYVLLSAIEMLEGTPEKTGIRAWSALWPASSRSVTTYRLSSCRLSRTKSRVRRAPCRASIWAL